MAFKRIGIIGGGQLGKMTILEGKKLGLSFFILDPAEDCPASSVADYHIVRNFYDKEGIKKLAELTDIITYEFEHIDAELLMDLEKDGYIIYPSPSTLKIIQDKFQQKYFLQQHGIPVPQFQRVSSIEELKKAVKAYGLPLLLKNCRGGYDGKGNFLIKTPKEIEKAFEILGGRSSKIMVEEYIPFEKEISVIVARGISGEMKVYPLGENIHENNILKTTIVPARVPNKIDEEAKALALKIMDIFKDVGLFCIEMFIDNRGKLFINEIAPRPHNSGHYTIEAANTSQFGQHLRAILELPLGDTCLISPAVMINLLGEKNYCGRAKLVGLEKALGLSGVYVHFYGKTITKPERKMGHVTILGDDIETTIKKANDVRNFLKVISG